MFKSIQWKVLTVFVLLIISVMIIVGTFLLNSVSSYYHNAFRSQMADIVFTDDFVNQLNTAAASEDGVESMRRILDVCAGRMGLNSYRNYYILDGVTAAVLYSYDSSSSSVEITQNLLDAMGGEIGDGTNRRTAVMDYAYPINAENSYIIYVCDSKNELYGTLENIFTIILWALLLGMAISVFLGLFLSRTIIAPIASLTKRAEKIAAGDFEQKLEVKSRDEIGQLTGTFNTMAAELSHMLFEIAREKTKVETIFRFMTDAVAAFDAGGEVMHINQAAKQLLSLGDDESLSFSELTKRLDIDVTLNEFIYLKHYEIVERDAEFDGRILKAQFAPLITEGQTADGVVVVIQDITEQEKLNMAQREFVANVSHELRTPLTTVKSYTETLMENSQDGSMEANFLAVIDNETDRMTRLVKDLLTLSLLDYDRTTLSKTAFSMPELIKSIIGKISMEAEKHHHTVNLRESGDMPQFYGDKDRIEQVIINIITNAIKYTPDNGIINISCEYVLTDVIIKVKDNGIGIPAADLPHLFERFYRVDKARSRKHGGTGLGLAIAKEMVEAHGGTIDIASVYGKGTTVTIKMPCYSK